MYTPVIVGCDFARSAGFGLGVDESGQAFGSDGGYETAFLGVRSERGGTVREAPMSDLAALDLDAKGQVP